MSENLDQAQEASHSGESTTLQVASEGLRRGSADAAEAATKAWESAGRFANRFVYTTCYTISYGIVFPAMLAASVIPRENAAVRGLIDGADAARTAADELAGSMTTPQDGPLPLPA